MMTRFVATLIARPGDVETLAAAEAACSDVYAPADRSVLAEREAKDVVFESGDDVHVIRHRIAGRIADLPVDVIVQPLDGRRKKLLVADMDSTMIGQECIDELAAYAGFRDAVTELTDRAMRGEIDFEPALRERVALLAGLEESTVAQVIEERISLSPGARDLVWTMRANGANTILVSGGFTVFAEPIGAEIGFDEVRANHLVTSGRRFTGEVTEPVLGPTGKLAALEDAIIRGNLTAADVLAVGDGANDMGMIARAGLGVAYHAKPRVEEAADARIRHTTLASLLFAQGYRRDQFVR